MAFQVQRDSVVSSYSRDDSTSLQCSATRCKVVVSQFLANSPSYKSVKSKKFNQVAARFTTLSLSGSMISTSGRISR